MKEMILVMQKNEGKLYIVQDLLQDAKPMASWNMQRNSVENAKDILRCNPAGLRWTESRTKSLVRSGLKGRL